MGGLSVLLHASRTLGGVYFLEEVVALVIDQNKGWEIFDFDFPDGFHSQLCVFDTIQALDTLLRQYSRRAADTAKIEPAMFMTGVGHLLASVAFCQHHHASAV
ncbi:hypothetical protein D3C75_1102960 [compost metagenome]